MVGIRFCGGAREVTGSVHQVFTDTSSVILDCGLFQGKRDEFYDVNSTFLFDPQHLDACILSHAHIDHCGNIPTLIKQGFRGTIYATPTTRDLCKFMLPDSGFVQEEDIKYVNKINKKRGLPPRVPLYTQSEGERALRYFRSLDYHTPFPVTKDITLTFYEAGHILGSTMPMLDVKTPKGKNIRIAYAVDLGRTDMPLLRNPEEPKDVNYLFIESTYGARKHGSIKDAENDLTHSINRALSRGGKIIIPSFALERTQMVVYMIGKLIKEKKIKKIPIYVDGPLAVNLTDVFRNNWAYCDEETQAAYRNEEDPLDYEDIRYVKNVNESKMLNSINKPVIIISASGMCENGRILHHLKNNIENPRNMILIVGYMAKNTLGRKIVEKEPTVRIFGRPYDLRAEVIVMNSFSSHADKDGLANYVGSCLGSLKGIFVVHGEPEQMEALRDDLRRKFNIRAKIPSKGDEVHLKA